GKPAGSPAPHEVHRRLRDRRRLGGGRAAEPMNAAMSAAWQRVAAALPMAVRVLTVVIAIAVIALLVKLGARIEWQTVFQAAREIPERALLAGAGLVVAGYAVYAGIDGLARRFLRHALPLHKTLA